MYGLPGGLMGTIGFLKVSLGLALLAGLWFPELTRFSAVGIVSLMTGVVVMHAKGGEFVEEIHPRTLTAGRPDSFGT